jgi:hypothetical protein
MLPISQYARWVILLGLAALVASGCTSLRPDACARRAMAGPDYAAMPDKRAHCLASAKIAVQCGARYARLAGVGKEWLDALGGGDASRGDLAANALGRECAKTARQAGDTSDAALSTCCIDALR